MKTTNKLVFFCKTYRNDLSIFKRLAQSFLKYNRDKIILFVSVPEKDLELFSEFESRQIIVMADESYAENYFADEESWGLKIGYINQEICKLAFWETGLGENYLCVDADTYFIRDFFVNDFMKDAETPYTVLCMDKDLSMERHYREFWQWRQELIAKIYQEVELDDLRLRASHGGVVMSTRVLKSFKNDFMAKKKYDYKDLIKISPYEFNWYNAWLQKSQIIKEYATEPFFKFFHNRADYLLSRLKLIDEDDLKSRYVGITLNSNWQPIKPPTRYENPDLIDYDFYKFFIESKRVNEDDYILEIGIKSKIEKLRRKLKQSNTAHLSPAAITKSNKKVLLVEPNPYHGVLLPGFTHYWQQLGFQVDIYCRTEVAAENPFALYPAPKLPQIFSGSAEEIKSFLSSGLEQNYDFLHLTSSAFWEKDVYIGSYLNYLGYFPTAHKNVFAVEHNPGSVFFSEDDSELFLLAQQLITLGQCNTASSAVVINPHYFGEIPTESTAQRSGRPKTILVVGSLSPDTKNLDLLFTALPELLETEIPDFKIKIIGAGTLRIPKNFQQHIEFLGWLSFADLYAELGKADYLLPLIDPTLPKHQRYLSGTTSGSFLLSLGFNVPLIIDQQVATANHFSDKVALYYFGEGSLFKGLYQALTLSESQYKRYRRSLQQLSQTIATQSLVSLQQLILIPPAHQDQLKIAWQAKHQLRQEKFDRESDLHKIHRAKFYMIWQAYCKHRDQFKSHLNKIIGLWK